MMKYLFLSIAILTLIVIGCNQQKDRQDLGFAKPFQLYDADSVSFALADYKNKPVLIHFWADWCTHCRQEFPKIQSAYTKIQPKGIEILAVNSGQTREHVLEIKTSFGLTFPLLVDEEAKTAEKYAVSGLPTSFIVDKKGKIIEKHIGWLEEKQILDIFNKIQDNDE